MASTVNFQQCSYLDQHTLPHAFASERAELVHINEQISSLDSHISQLTTLRSTLLRRSGQLHNKLTPIHTLPIEILSYIFQELVNSHHYDYPCFDWCEASSHPAIVPVSIRSHEACLRQAFILGSVSSHFRHVALGTPEIWKRIPIVITNGEAIDKASSLLQFCITLAPSVDISVCLAVDEEKVRLAFDVLLTPDTMRKVKSFTLSQYHSPSNLWIDKFKGSCSPVLNTLSLGLELDEASVINMGSLTTVTRLSMCAPLLGHSIIVPPSVQYLDIYYVSQQVLVSLLYQCPNLVELDATIDCDIEDGSDADAQFTEPLTLPHLKTLFSSPVSAFVVESSVENLRLPSLEYLYLPCLRSGAVLLYRNVSTTLTTLVIGSVDEESDYEDLMQLCRIPVPELRKLKIYWNYQLPPFTRVLELFDGNSNDSKPHCFPALRSVTLCCHVTLEPHSLLDLLKEWKIGETFYFHIHFRGYGYGYHQWSPELLEQLKSIVGSRQIEVTWGYDKIHELGVQGGSLRGTIRQCCW
jgi:hypothetical protein